MPTESATTYKDCLPRLKRISWLDFFNIICGFCSAVSLGLAFFYPEQHNNIFSYYLVTISLLIIGYHVYQVRTKDDRLKSGIIYAHYVSHLIRDYLADLDTDKSKSAATVTKELNELIANILESVSECFSVVTGRKCRVTMKGMCTNDTPNSNDYIIWDIRRDKMSKGNYDKKLKGNNLNPKTIKHYLADNTDFRSLLDSEHQCARYFLCNDLESRWLMGDYDNSSFDIYGKPKTINLSGRRSQLIWWPLPYKSTIVLPVRYVPNDMRLSAQGSNLPTYLGFLCIDSKSKNIFDTVYHPELGGMFADSLYIIIKKVHDLNVSSN